MKKIFTRTGLLLAIPLLFATCSKFDWDLFDKHHGKGDCQVASYSLFGAPHPDIPWLFKKKFNSAGRVTEIECAFNTLVQGTDPGDLYLRLAYHGNRVYFINKKNPYDTVVKVFLNTQGRVTHTIGDGERMKNNWYYYRGNKLHIIEFNVADQSVHRSTCEYDNRGNILSISSINTYSNKRDGIFYEYDYSRNAKRQFYMDETRNMNFTFTLLHYLGFFPELNPVNVRTHVRVGLETEGYILTNQTLVNHQFDAKGNLTQYDVITDSEQYFAGTPKLSWYCK
jgi:hypothetical protein